MTIKLLGMIGGQPMVFAHKSRFDSLSLEFRATLGVVFLAVIAAFALIYELHQHQRERLMNEYSETLHGNVRLNVTRILLNTESLRRDVQFLARTPPIQGIVRASQNHGYDAKEKQPIEFWKQRMLDISTAFAEARPDYYQIRYVGVADHGRELVRIDTKDGKVVVTPPDKLQEKEGRDYFQATLKLKPGEIYLSEVNLNREFGKIEEPHRRTLRASAPIFAPDGKIFGMFVINMDIGRLLDRISTGLPSAVSIYLANSEGDYLLHPDAGHTFGFDLGRRFRWQQEFSGLHLATGKDTESNKSVLSVDTDKGMMHIISSQVNFDPVHPERFLLLLEMFPDAVIAKNTDQILGLTLVVPMTVLLVIAVLVLLAVRHMFAPFGQLIEAAHSISQGKYDQPLPEQKKGDIGKLILAFKDMQTQIKQREVDIRRLNADLERRVHERTIELSNVNRELESFSYAVSHDLRAPLRAMSGFSRALEEDYGSQLHGEGKNYLDQITIASSRMSNLIDGLLLLSRCTRGDLMHDVVDISSLSLRLLDELSRHSPERKVTVEVEEGLHAYGDARMIEAVMRNLLGNAWKYTERTAAPVIRVSSKMQDGVRRYCVADNGAGFDMAHANRLFKPFQRLHRQDEFEGIGIGLATVQRIVHYHGGVIEASGEPGKGAVFCFTLPGKTKDLDQHEKGA